jgi:hypothetical protein
MTRPTLTQWRANLREDAQKIPWRGPQPLREGDHLVSRSRVIRDFMEELKFKPLIVLSAASGAGKSSLLEAGLLPKLRSRRVPIICSEWARPGTGTIPNDLERFLCELAADTLEPSLAEKAANYLQRGGHEPFTSFVTEHIPRTAVVILDQFEELIRLNRPAFLSALDWIHRATTANHIRVVISLRLEYTHELRHLEKLMAPREVRRFDLEPVTSPEAVAEIVNLGTGGKQIEQVTDKFVRAVVEAWEDADSAPRSGLLGLQALLYSTFRTMLEQEATAIGPEVFSKYVPLARVDREPPSAEGAHAAPSNSTPFDAALPEAAKMKVESCLAALRGTNGQTLDPYLESGTAELVRETTQHLDSGGFKLHREVWELAQRCLDRELELLGHDLDTARAILNRVAKATSALDSSTTLPNSARYDLLAEPALSLSRAAVEDALLRGQPWTLDRHEVTSGPMLGLSADQVLVEEFRRFLFALTWLKESSLVRITAAPSENQWVVSLIHDGFGKALAEWAKDYPHGPLTELTRLTGSRGQTFRWARRGNKPTKSTDVAPWPELNQTTILNVRWRDCEVPGLYVKGVRFVNCDFRGTRFKQCAFEGVVFVNCLLDGVTFSECTVIGSAGEYVGYYGENKGAPDVVLAPSFEIPVTGESLDRAEARALHREIEALRWYRGESEPADGLVSHTSGMSVVPLTAEHRALFEDASDSEDALDDGMLVSKPWRGPLPPVAGGLSMLGGRLSSLMFRRTTFLPDDAGTEGEIALRLVTGTALDVVEHSKGTLRLTITGSAVRGLTVTGHHGKDDMANVEIHINDCLLTQTWFGDGLKGVATIKGSRLWHLTNLSSPNATRKAAKNDPGKQLLAVTVQDSRYAHLANIRVPGRDADGLEVPPPFDVDADSPIDKISFVLNEVDRSAIAALSSRMDYQSSPAEAEYERREDLNRDGVTDRKMTWPGFNPPGAAEAN